ncbi:hypothetical protein MVES1_002089 [Malassezia vespertilionis]|uniref:uncharacterized protein n=1 Tax=Malassezia vespertilionis TaxID=2020962 RepID=UPI0024B255FC|nr:uncharacterized protein MVES1_002089 [Malassezia vespertilionis]WFD06735.1 hypothetical protein MVES1_002089 [Malassezia vespertilionis]
MPESGLSAEPVKDAQIEQGAGQGETLALLHTNLTTLETNILPALARAGDAFFERMYVYSLAHDSTYTLANPADGDMASASLERLDAQLNVVQTFLASTGLAGMPLGAPCPDAEAVRTLSHRVFEQRARLNDASAMVASILTSEE